MESIGTLESFYPSFANTPFITQAAMLQTFHNSIYSVKTTPTPPTTAAGTKKTLAQRLGLKVYEHNNHYYNDRENIATRTYERTKKCATPAFDTLPDSPKTSFHHSDYKNIKSKVKSFRSKTRQDSDNEIPITMKDKVRNELMLNYNHYIMRTIKKATRNDEYKTSGRYLDSTNLFNRLSSRMASPELEMKPFKQKPNFGTGKIIHKRSKALSKIIADTNINWLEKHGNIQDLASSSQISKIIFEMIDPDNKGEVSCLKFIDFLIEIGMPMDPKSLYQLICKIKRSTNLEGLKIYNDDISNLCRGDNKTNSILLTIIEELLGPNDNSWNSIESVNILSLFEVLRRWWNECDDKKYNYVHCNKVCEIIVDKKVASDLNEAYKIVGNFAVGSHLDFCKFQQIFGKALIKHALTTIQHKFSVEDWENPEFSYALKLSQLKRQLVFAGIYFPVPQISLNEGLATLQAIEKYAKFKKEPIVRMNYEEFCSAWLELTGETIGRSAFKPQTAYYDEHSAEIASKITQKVLNRYTIIGNYKPM